MFYSMNYIVTIKRSELECEVLTLIVLKTHWCQSQCAEWYVEYSMISKENVMCQNGRR